MKRIELLEEKMKCLEEKLRMQSQKSLLRFTMSTMVNFRPADFHRRYYDVLTKFAHGEIKKLMVFIAPQHGKSEGSTRRLPAFILGIKPDTRVAMVSYSAQKAMKFNRELQRIIDTEEYRNIFPGTLLNGKNVSSLAKEGNWMRNAYECEIVGHTGGFKTVGVGGALTGEPVDVMIMDDIYKDAASAWSPNVRENISDWYDTVAETRLHNDSQQLIVFTRWHEDDLAGKLIREQGEYHPTENPDGWVIVTYKAIKEGAPTEYDPREEGEALWPERHSLHKLELIRKRNPHVFESLYQQNPMPFEGLMYSQGFRTYSAIPASRHRIVKSYCDSADTGADYLCDIIYVETETANYVLDVLYTQKPMEYTEAKTAERYTKHMVQKAVIESNNGGRGFARNVESQCRIMGNTTTRFSWFTQTKNKQVRIFTHSAEVQNLTYFPEGWERLWPEFHNAVMGYLKEGKNAHDDACFVAGTKVATIFGDKPIEKIVPGDIVITPFGWRKVLASGCTGEKDVVTMFGLTATPNHHVYNRSGFIELVCCDESELSRYSLREQIRWKYKKLLCLEELSTDLWGRENITLASRKAMKDGDMLKDFMSRFGKMLMEGQFRKAIAFTIETATLSIMTSAIWSVYRLGNICRTIHERTCKMLTTERGTDGILTKQEKKPMNGTEAKKEERGTAKTPRTVNWFLKRLCARIVESIFSLYSETQCFVATIAERNTEQSNLTMSECAGSAERSSFMESANRVQEKGNSVASRAAQHTATSTASVYNIKVDKDGCFYANGILVSNCDALTGTVEHRESTSRENAIALGNLIRR